MASKIPYIFLFFKKFGCPPCDSFYRDVFQSKNKKDKRLIYDEELKNKVEFRIVEIGEYKNSQGKIVRRTINANYPDMVSKVLYAPFFWFHPQGNRDKGVEYSSTMPRTVDSIKKWIFDQIDKYEGKKDTPTISPTHSIRDSFTVKPPTQSPKTVVSSRSLISSGPIPMEEIKEKSLSSPKTSDSKEQKTGTLPKAIGNGNSIISAGFPGKSGVTRFRPSS